jgi:monofunctional biosynthetic peptidoglycan transglycosylase
MVKKTINSAIGVFFRSLLLHPYLFLKKVCLYTGAFVLSLVSALVILAVIYFYTLPPIETMSFEGLKKTAQSHVYGVLKDKKKQYRWVPLAQVNRDYLYTIVMAEDSNFFQHNGINYDALLSSLAENIKRREFAYGASTITQQVAKNLFLSSEKSLLRKLREYTITRALEKRFTKNQILEIYLNIVETGNDLYGVRAASWNYFSKYPADIQSAEGALIALLLPSPRRYAYSIFQNRHLSPDNQRKYLRILKDMRYHEFISPEQYNLYRNYERYLKNPA